MGNNIILSICIPTYNRAEYLEETILSIVNQKRFQETSEVEIVISDNCSEDNTKQVCEKFIAICGDKIHYYRNSENIIDANFERVLSYGKGVFLKLNNDTLVHQENTLEIFLETINQNIEDKEIIFFSNGVIKKITKCYCENLDSFVKTVSYYSTWIGGFGIWKEDFDSIDGFSRKANLQLVQTDVLFRLISLNRSVLIDNTKICNSVYPKTKSGYNFYQVFVMNYLGLFEEYRIKNQISRVTLFNEKTKLMIYYVVPRTIQLLTKRDKYAFSHNKALSIVLKKYMFHPILYLGFFYLVLRIILYHLKGFLKINI